MADYKDMHISGRFAEVDIERVTQVMLHKSSNTPCNKKIQQL